MEKSGTLYPGRSGLDTFMYAFVGEDRNGSMVTVLSTLARLGLDPWKEASDLAALSEDAALSRLTVLLARVHDVPALVGEHKNIAQKLVAHLPTRGAGSASNLGQAAQNLFGGRSAALLITIAWLLQMLAGLLAGVPGP